ncbi:hypothetical protein EXIGLDRAFT_485109 [Exidia glandulosa HHB12029]|uniref:F-box domain-containing protein n=1 Tax=Exidia glandulosa HHB12029 TaxID=1314781 RepID=A0A165JPU1_EXIGL|nr:hypothetical protein EXIGLDRAFT_485109 [Exidia glandulosa HHB12029]
MSSQTTLRRLVTGRQREDAAEGVSLYMSARLDREFDELVKRVFSDARDALGRPLSAARCTVLAEATELSFKRALATTLGRYNDKPKLSPSSAPALRAYGFLLPDELWLMVWQELSMDDRISVSRVCGAWRTLALASPKLWSQLDFFTDRHSMDGCSCDTCIALRNGYSMSCSQGHEVAAVGRTNVDIIRCLIPRSRRFPLSLSIVINASVSDAELDNSPFLTLATALRPHASRIVRIDIDESSDAVGSMAEFFAFFKELPALRALTLGEEPRGYQFLTPIALPLLRHLDIGGSLLVLEEPGMSTENGTPLTFPSVSTLEYKIGHESSLDKLFSDLDRFPNLDTLWISNTQRLWDPDELSVQYHTLNVRGARIPHVHAKEVGWNESASRGISSEKLILALFHRPSRPTFSMSYRNPLHSGAVFEERTEINAPRIFADLGGNIELSFTTGPGGPAHGCTADATDSSGIRRSVQCPSKFAVRIYPEIAMQAITAITVQASMYHDVMLGLKHFPSLQRLTLVLSAYYRLPTLEPLSGHCALPTLRLEGLSGQTPCLVRAADIVSFIRCICGNKVPNSVELARVRLDGDIDSRLAGVVREIR